ncbi:hypothetical protein [Piscirickettsia salmonis]|uniref:hypothetical protein n=1 Tax=Piscirickettsia salmonis TaxID=1238 RepID=UPI0012BAA476|nr:hypothetical protein [Piscirickettsia salmonis]QGP59451.1 hypothetical protein PsalBI1_02039 [Piscirickettsia salmonis]
MVIQRQKDETYQIQFTLKHVLQYRSAWWNYRAKHADSIRPAVEIQEFQKNDPGGNV